MVSISNGTDYNSAGDSESVTYFTGYRYQYTAEQNQVWISFTGDAPDADDADPAFKVSIKLLTFRTGDVDDDGAIDVVDSQIITIEKPPDETVALKIDLEEEYVDEKEYRKRKQ